MAQVPPRADLMRQPARTAAGHGVLQRKCACEESGTSCPRCAPNSELRGAPAAVSDVIAGPGEGLDGRTRGFMEPRFGADFSGVRVHTGPSAAEAARAVHAQAFTVGQDVVFGDRRFAPDTIAGRQLLAHELAHVVQQTSGDVPASAAHAATLEADAERASSALEGPGSVHVASRSAVAIARQPEDGIPPELGFLTSDDIRKLRAFGEADFRESIRTLQSMVRKTKGITAGGDPHQFTDIRQAAGELATVLDKLRDPDVTALKAVSGQPGGRSPDQYVRRNSTVRGRVEIVNVTLTAKDERPDVKLTGEGTLAPTMPKRESATGAQVADLPTKEFKYGQIREAIRGKVKPRTPTSDTQFTAQNPNTRVQGSPMEVGGELVVHVHGAAAVEEAELTKIITGLTPQIGSEIDRITINAVDATDRAGRRKAFQYTREGAGFRGSVRPPYYGQGGAASTAAAAASQPASTPAAATPPPRTRVADDVATPARTEPAHAEEPSQQRRIHEGELREIVGQLDKISETPADATPPAAKRAAAPQPTPPPKPSAPPPTSRTTSGGQAASTPSPTKAAEPPPATAAGGTAQKAATTAAPPPTPAAPTQKPAAPAQKPAAPAQKPAAAASPPSTAAGAPTVVGPAFSRPSDAVAKAEERATQRGMVAVAILEAVGQVLTNIGDKMQQDAVNEAFYAKQDEILKELDRNPGMGAIVEFMFRHTEPHPDAVLRPGDRFVGPPLVQLAASPRDVQPGIYPDEQGTTLRIKRLWIKPTRPAPAERTSGETRTPVALTNLTDAAAKVEALRRQAHLPASAVAIAFKEAKLDFVTARVDFAGTLLDIPSGIFLELRRTVEERAIESLTRAIRNAASGIADLRRQYDMYSKEGIIDRFVSQREFELPPPTVLKNAEAYIQTAQEWLTKRDFAMARSHYQSAVTAMEKVQFLLYHYTKGERHWLEDEP
jgi:uncharacterized protein DUF4157